MQPVVSRIVLVVLAAWLYSQGDPSYAQHRDVAPIPGDLVRTLANSAKPPITPASVRALNKHLDDLTDIARGEDSESQRMLMAGKKNEIATVRNQLRRDLAKIRADLESLALTDKIKGLDDFSSQLDARFDRIGAALAANIGVKTADARGQGLRQLRSELQALHGDVVNRQQVAEPVPTISVSKPPPYRPVVPSQALPIYLAQHRPGPLQLASLEMPTLAAAPPTPTEAASCSYVSADLAATADAPLTPEIVALAEKLGYAPARIFEYVYNNIQFEPYYGSLKGAAATLYAKAGGPTDQASLLIALLRASNIPARYVRGQVALRDSPSAPNYSTGGRVGQWVGAKSYAAAKEILDQGLFNPAPISQNGTGAPYVGVIFNHVWVEACLPYAHYRGSAFDKSGHRWVPFDPSYKDKTYQPGIAHTQTFDYDTYMSRRQNGPSSLPQEAYANQVEASIRNANPNDTAQDVPYKGVISPISLDILPNSLPFDVVNFTNWPGTSSPEIAQLPAAHRYQWFIGGLSSLPFPASPNPIPGNVFSLYLPDVALKRVTLSFAGANTDDQLAINNWLASSSGLPCTTQINVLPVIMVDGVAQTLPSGVTSVPLCSDSNSLKMNVVLQETANPSANPTTAYAEYIGQINSVSYTNIGSANWHALQAYAFQGSNTLIAQRVANLIQAVNSTPNPNVSAAAIDATQGEFLHVVGLKYMRYITDAFYNIGVLDGGSGQSGNHLGLVSSQMKVQYVFDLPFAVSTNGLYVDVQGAQSRSVDNATGDIVYKTFLLSAYAASAYESYVLQENVLSDAVSAVRGLQYARETGIQILTLTSANWGDCNTSGSNCYLLTHNSDSTLNYTTNDVTSIYNNYVTQGFTVTIPRSLISYSTTAPTWKGAVYIAERNNLPTSANANLVISKYAGGWTLQADDSLDSYNSATQSEYVVAKEIPVQTVQSQIATPGVADSPVVLNLPGANGVPTVSGGDPVNMVSGNMYHVERDIFIKGRGGLPIVFERNYNSQKPADGPLGFGWTHSFNHVLKFYGVENSLAKVSWTDGTGREVFFAAQNHTAGDITLNSTQPNPAGIFVRFQRLSDGSYSIREKNGLTYKFASATGPSGVPGGATTPVFSKLTAITERNGNTLTLNYSASCGNQLCSVTDAIGRSLTFTYSGNRITQIQDVGGRVFQYAYDGNGNLTSFKNPLAVSNAQNPVSYAYYTGTDGTNLNHLMKQYTLPRGNGMRFEYYANGRTFRHTVVLTDGSLSADQVNTFTYNDFRRETVQTNERGYDRHFFFDPYGNPVRIVEENGATRSYTYDCADFTQAAGTAGCPRPHNRLAKTDPTGLATQYQYDTDGNVTTITNPSGSAIRFFDFSPYGQPRRIQDANGRWAIQRFDGNGNLIDVIRTAAAYTPPSCSSAECPIPAAGQILAWAKRGYDSVGNPTVIKQVRDFPAQISNDLAGTNTGPLLTYTYSANQLDATGLSRIGIKNSDVSPTAVNSAVLVYDNLGRLTNGVDQDWYPAQFAPDALDRIAQATDALGNLRSIQFDANGNRTGDTLVLGVGGTPTLMDSRSARYDDSDRMVAATDAGGFVTAYRYDAGGNVEAFTTPDNYTLRFRYDEANRVVEAYDAQNHSVSTTRDTDGRIRTVTDPNGNTRTYTYWTASQDGRLKSITSPRITDNGTGTALTSGRAVEYDYDANGNVITVTEIPAAGSGQTNRVTRTEYDELNRPIRGVGPQYTDASLGAVCPVTRKTYDSLSRLTQVEAGYTPGPSCLTGASTVTVQALFAYDDFGRLIRNTDALGRFWTYSYDANNNVATATDPKGQTTAYGWSTGHQLASRVEQGGRTTSYTRNALGQVTQQEHPEVTYAYAYDGAHRLASVLDGRGQKRLAYSWSPGGLLNSVTDADNRLTYYTYDPVGRLSGIAAPNGDTTFLRFDEGRRLIQSAMPSGVVAHYFYNEDDSIKQVANHNGNPYPYVSQHDYAYDGFGNRSGHAQWINGTSIAYGYGYDELGRLTLVTNGTAAEQEAYAYDPLGNRRTKAVGQTGPVVTAYNHDAANQLMEMRYGSPSGSLIAALAYDNAGNVLSDGTRTYTWDALNQLSQVTNGATTVGYGYDGDGRRVRKVAGGTTTQWLYDGQNIYAEYGSAWTNPAAVYSWAGLDRPQSRSVVTGASSYGQTQYYAADGLGTVVGASNNTDTTLQSQRFDAWGNKLASSGAAIPQYGFTGREPDETGIVYYRARYYNPVTGRFLSRDPIGLAGGINLYTYVNNNPVNFTDPSGLIAAPSSASFSGDSGGGGKGASVNGAYASFFNLDATASAGSQTVQAFSNQPVPHAEVGEGPVQVAVGPLLPLLGIGLIANEIANSDVPFIGAGIARGAAAAAERGVSVLGHFPGYVNTAESIGARYFNVPTEFFARMSPVEQWAANTKFLDRLITRGDAVLLSTPAAEARAGSWFAQELEYLSSRGYRLSADGKQMFPPGPR